MVGYRIGESSLDLPHLLRDPLTVEFAGSHRRDLGDGINVIRESENGRLNGLDHRFRGGSFGEGATEPLQPGIEVGEQQIVLGREVTIERAQGDTGVRSDLLRGRLLDAVCKKSHDGSAAQRIPRSLASYRPRWSSHVQTVTQLLVRQSR
ncbi:MAG TPA: hypothetical protein VJ831_00835 [Jatrophihabitantaceae bacterium]|nr:hypothetical protein [Jatrophihabitantaceae bacterium]